MSRLEPMVDPKLVRRVEIITGDGRRRWSESEKAAIIEETLAPGAVISAVARRRGLSPQQLFTWRRAARRKMTSAAGFDAPGFVPASFPTARPPVMRIGSAVPSNPRQHSVGRAASTSEGHTVLRSRKLCQNKHAPGRASATRCATEALSAAADDPVVMVTHRIHGAFIVPRVQPAPGFDPLSASRCW